MLLDLTNSLQQFVAFVFALLIAIDVHEFAHAWMANFLGDPTAKKQGRLSLNPFVHLDLVGTIFLFLAGFGWGKPVPFNPHNLGNPKIDSIKISLAGPVSNLLLAVILGLGLRWIPFSATTFNFLIVIITINLVLMTFNLLPIPPLDGSHILQIFLSPETYFILQQVGFPILVFFLIFSNYYPIISIIVTKVTTLFFTLVLGQSIEIP